MVHVPNFGLHWVRCTSKPSKISSKFQVRESRLMNVPCWNSLWIVREKAAFSIRYYLSSFAVCAQICLRDTESSRKNITPSPVSIDATVLVVGWSGTTLASAKIRTLLSAISLHSADLDDTLQELGIQSQSTVGNVPSNPLTFLLVIFMLK